MDEGTQREAVAGAAADAAAAANAATAAAAARPAVDPDRRGDPRVGAVGECGEWGTRWLEVGGDEFV